MSILKKGFTLLELLVVIAIIGLLVAIVTPSLSRSRASARDGKRKVDLEQIRAALEVYRGDQTPPSYPSGADQLPDGVLNVLTTGNYISALPDDPLAANDYYYRALNANGSTCGSGCQRYALCANLETESPGTTSCTTAGLCGGNCDYQVGSP